MTIAFTFTTNEFYYVVLSGEKDNPVFNSKNKIKLPANYSIPQTVLWFETQLDLIINAINPNAVSYKLTINNITNSYVSNVYYGQAILNLICSKKNIPITHMSPSSLVPSKFNLPKGADLHKHIDDTIGTHPPYWDKTMKDTALISLTLLQ